MGQNACKYPLKLYYFYATHVPCTHHFSFLQDKNVSDDMGKTSEDSSSDED